MKYEYGNRIRTGDPGPLAEITMLAMGFALGWLVASARRAPAPRQNTLIPPPLGSWKQGAFWSNLTQVSLDELIRSTPAERGASLEEISAVQLAVDESSAQAYADTSTMARDRHDKTLGQQARVIHETTNAFDMYFAAKAPSLVGSDISRLKSLSSKLQEEGRKIPTETKTIDQVNAYLGVFNQLIGLVK